MAGKAATALIAAALLALGLAGPGQAGPPEQARPAAVTGAPSLGPGVRASVRAIARRGAAAGDRADVFAKVGDSITESQSFLSDVGHGWSVLGGHGELRPTIAFYRRRTLGRRDGEEQNSFTRASRAATTGWDVRDALRDDRGGSPVREELRAIHPAVALVMFGTNDLERVSPDSYRRSLRTLTRVLAGAGTVPVLSTIPDRLDSERFAARVPRFNAVVRGLARGRYPLMDLNAALRPLPRHGVSGDGIHPSILHGSDGAVFTAAGLRYGYNVRNLLALETLRELRPLVGRAYR